MITEHISTCIY